MEKSEILGILLPPGNINGIAGDNFGDDDDSIRNELARVDLCLDLAG